MKRIVYVCATALLFAAVSCGGGQGNQNQNQDKSQSQEGEQPAAQTLTQSKAFPWDYPEGVKAAGLEAGCHALVPKSVYVTSENPAEENYVFNEVTIKKVGDKSSVYAGDVLMDEELPNSLIIPLHKNQTAKVGDVLLTWWQSGWGSQRAIVTDASDPARPKVAYLDLIWDEESGSSVQKNLDQQLEAGTFTVLKSNEWQPGQSIVFNFDGSDEIFRVVSVSDNKVLAYRYDGKIHVLDRSKCTLIPTDQQLKVGDKVRALSFGSLSDGDKIKEVDARNGRVVVAGVLNDNNLSILEVLK